MAEKKKKNLKIVSTVLVLHFLVGSLGLAVFSYFRTDMISGYVALGMFVVFGSLYLIWGGDYISGDLFHRKTNDKIDTSENNTLLQILNIYIIINFLIGPLLMGMLYYWGKMYRWVYISIGFSLLCAVLYWVYGIDYFNVNWLYKIKYGETKQK